MAAQESSETISSHVVVTAHFTRNPLANFPDSTDHTTATTALACILFPKFSSIERLLRPPLQSANRQNTIKQMVCSRSTVTPDSTTCLPTCAPQMTSHQDGIQFPVLFFCGYLRSVSIFFTAMTQLTPAHRHLHLMRWVGLAAEQ